MNIFTPRYKYLGGGYFADLKAAPRPPYRLVHGARAYQSIRLEVIRDIQYALGAGVALELIQEGLAAEATRIVSTADEE